MSRKYVKLTALALAVLAAPTVFAAGKTLAQLDVDALSKNPDQATEVSRQLEIKSELLSQQLQLETLALERFKLESEAAKIRAELRELGADVSDGKDEEDAENARQSLIKKLKSSYEKRIKELESEREKLLEEKAKAQELSELLHLVFLVRTEMVDGERVGTAYLKNELIPIKKGDVIDGKITVVDIDRQSLLLKAGNEQRTTRLTTIRDAYLATYGSGDEPQYEEQEDSLPPVTPAVSVPPPPPRSLSSSADLF